MDLQFAGLGVLPFPQAIAKRNAGKLAKSDPDKLFIGLGGFDCKNQSIANAYIQFLSMMTSSEAPVGELYKSSVGIVKS